MHPRHEVEREYAVRVFGEVEPKTLKLLETGVELEDGLAKFTKIIARPNEEESINAWYNVSLSEGRNREVRRLWESQGVQVSRLIRLRYGPLSLQKRLPQGAWIELELNDVNALRKQVQLPPETETLVGVNDNKLNHTKLSRMRKSVKKHKDRNAKAPIKGEGESASDDTKRTSRRKPNNGKPQANRNNAKKGNLGRTRAGAGGSR